MTDIDDEKQSQALLDRLPHRPPMRLLHRIRQLTLNEATCETIANDSIAALFPKPEGIDPLIGIELIAQCSALPLIESRNSSAPLSGMLVQIRSVSIISISVPIGSTLGTTVKIETLADSGFVIASGSVIVGTAVICEGSVTLALQK